MGYYPVCMELSAVRCLVVGAGAVGCRKIRSLLDADPQQIFVLDVNPPSPTFQVLLEDSRITFAQRSVTQHDIEGCGLVFAATGDRETNARLTAWCTAAGILCNSIDAPEEGSFIVPAQIRRGNIMVALSTGGGSPALAKVMRQELEVWIGDRFEKLSELLSRLRPLVLAMQRETGQNTALFRSLVESPLADALQQQNRTWSEALLRELLPQELHPHIMELLHDLA